MNITTFKRASSIFISILFVISIIGCASKPSESSGKDILVKDLSANTAIKVTGFRKTNGIEKTAEGMKKYIMEFEADIEYAEKGQAIGGGLIGLFLAPPVPAGTKQLLKGTIEFTKTEKGWIGATNVLTLVAVTKK